MVNRTIREEDNGVSDEYEYDIYCDALQDQEDARREIKFDDNWERYDG